jgi:hypothetical protein
MSKGTIELVGGVALIAAGEFTGGITTGLGIKMSLAHLAQLSSILIQSGAGLTLAGVGTMLSKGPIQGFATASRNPVAPQNVVYGRCRQGGRIVRLST